MLALNEHSTNSLAQLLWVTQVITLVLEWALVVVAAHELKCCIAGMPEAIETECRPAMERRDNAGRNVR